ncbi:response regulator [Solidesulfovibrio alcoholivorans]|uniref:response regulator n=1 Tax=Solidesulfovibrio alcoholivorans TaxID=81406 RepID=UPI000693263F|nr:response regulator [Solidesulfovibrio alcoholivorans]
MNEFPKSSADGATGCDPLEAAQATIARLTAEVDAARQVKADFMARMTHEMRTPLSAIIGLANLALPLAADARSRDYLDKILASARGLLGVVDDITDFNRLEKGLAALSPAPFDLIEALGRVTGRFAVAARARGLVLASRLDSRAPTALVGDDARLEGVLAHLVGNAVKFTENGRVDLAVDLRWRRDAKVRLAFSVRDTGIGMDREAIPDMLESFTQGDGSLSRPYGGTGLGLALVQRGAALLGGELAVASEPGQGTVFSFEATFDEDLLRDAPAAEPEAATPARPREAVAPGRPSAPLADTLLLLVEDNAINQQVAREILMRLGAAVDVAAHGREAVEMAGRALYDAVLMDVQMPVMDGLAATRAIRALPGGADVPIIALTAHALAEDRDRCLAAGMNDYLTKPIDPERLLAALGQWIAPAANGAAAAGVAEVSRDPAPARTPPPPPGIDAAKGLARLGGNAGLFCSVAAEFVRDYGQSAQELERRIRDGDAEGARRLAHTVKGVAGNIAADVLAAAARDVEAALGKGCVPARGLFDAYATALAAAVADASRLAAPAPAPSSDRERMCLHILLVDDAKLNLAVFSQILREAGHETVTAKNGKEACRALFGERPGRPFDCILMDIEMPEMDGITASRVIRGLLAASASPPCPRDIPIVALTSHDADAERDRCLAAGMDACCNKSFEREALLCAIDTVMRDRPFGRAGHGKGCTASGHANVSDAALAATCRRLAGHLRAGSVRADEALLALRQALSGRPTPPELEALARDVERYAFAEALERLRAMAKSLGIDARALLTGDGEGGVERP